MPKYYTYLYAKNGERIDFILESGSRKNYTLAVREGKLTVRVPNNFSKEKVNRLINENLDWIQKALSLSAEKNGLPVTFEEGEKIRILGESFLLHYELADKYFPAEIKDGKLVVSVNPNSDMNYKKNEVMKFICNTANKEISRSMELMTSKTGLYPKKVTIKSMTASWGRCSSEGNISINYKLVTFPREYINYVCLHELCHLVHMDHSPDFWQLVEKYCPDWKTIRKNMRY